MSNIPSGPSTWGQDNRYYVFVCKNDAAGNRICGVPVFVTEVVKHDVAFYLSLFDDDDTTTPPNNHTPSSTGPELNQASPYRLATLKYYHTDALGSPVLMTNEGGAVDGARRYYQPYGAPTDGSYQNGPGYTGHVTDKLTQLTYAQQRYYDPMLGRFLSMDPVGVDGTQAKNFNRYAYANNNPYKFTDPDGRETAEAYKAIYRADGGVPNKLPMQTTAEKVIVGGTMALVAAPVLALLPDAGVAFGFSDTGAATSAAAMDQTALSAARTAASTAEAAGAKGASSALVTTTGEVFTGASANAGGPGIATNPIVQQALNRIPSVLRACWHGGCGEVNAASNALNAGAAVEGGAMATVRTVGGEWMEACPTCSRLLYQLGVRAVEP